jgi:hypothetical protein
VERGARQGALAPPQPAPPLSAPLAAAAEELEAALRRPPNTVAGAGDLVYVRKRRALGRSKWAAAWLVRPGPSTPRAQPPAARPRQGGACRRLTRGGVGRVQSLEAGRVALLSKRPAPGDAVTPSELFATPLRDAVLTLGGLPPHAAGALHRAGDKHGRFRLELSGAASGATAELAFGVRARWRHWRDLVTRHGRAAAGRVPGAAPRTPHSPRSPRTPGRAPPTPASLASMPSQPPSARRAF